MLREVKPKTARGKRTLAQRESKQVENPKTSLFFRGSTCSQAVQDCLSELFALRQPLSKKFTKKNNAIHPFEDVSSLEFFSEKNDASILLFGSSSKKRPHALTLSRTFGAKVLDMLELHLDPASFRMIKQFRGKKPAVGSRPMVLFAGTAFESPVADEYTLAKSMLLDFFRCEGGSAPDSGKVDVEGLQHIVSISCDEPSSTSSTAAAGRTGSTSTDPSTKPAIHIRVYKIRTKRSGGKLPRVELDEMGPRMDFRVGRSRQADEAMLKQAMKKGKTGEEKTKKNVSMDIMGDKLGRIHLGTQDLGTMGLRKFKGLKRGRGEDGEDDDNNDAPQQDVDGGEKKKAKR